MGYSMHDHIYYILKVNSKRPHDLSLIGRKPKQILKLKWKRLRVLKFKTKLNLKFMMKENNTARIMKGSINREGLTQVKAI